MGYTARIGEKWEIAGAFEKANLNVGYLDYNTTGITNLFQPMPDITLHFKYRWNGGHVQLGALYRNLTYYSRIYLLTQGTTGLQGTMYDYDMGVNCHNSGYGISLSGSIKPTTSLNLSWQAVAGRGMSEYLPEFAGENSTMGLLPMDKNSNHRALTPLPVGSFVLSAQYYWTPSCLSSLIASSSKFLKRYDDVAYATRFNRTFSVLGNFFWYFSDFAYIGGECLFGLNKLYPDDSHPLNNSGHAFSVAAVVAYLF